MTVLISSWYKQKKWFLRDIAAAQVAENHEGYKYQFKPGPTHKI